MNILDFYNMSLVSSTFCGSRVVLEKLMVKMIKLNNKLLISIMFILNILLNVSGTYMHCYWLKREMDFIKEFVYMIYNKSVGYT